MDRSDLSRYRLGGIGRVPVLGCPGFYMRVDDDVRKCVVFFGIADDAPGKDGIQCCGTGFLLQYGHVGYLVTARHVAEGLGSEPFLVRLNTKDGTAANFDVDNVKWHFHPDADVDVALIPFQIRAEGRVDALYLPSEMLALEPSLQNDEVKVLGSIGPGDVTYTVGLFHLLSGRKKNLPVVHSGSIAAVPKDERIPVTDWRDSSKTVFVEGYLVETQALPGLSGSPVFVRRTLNFSSLPQNFLLDPRMSDPSAFMVAAPQHTMHLLGLWQSSWDAPPGDVVSISRGKNVRVPVGMGVVAPAQKILETLNTDELKEGRRWAKEQVEKLNAAKPD